MTYYQKMKRITTIAALVLALCGCKVQEIAGPEPAKEASRNEGVTAIVTDFEMLEFKTSLNQEGDNPPVFAWKEGDVIGIVPADASTYQTNYKVKEIGEDPHTAAFDGGAWALKQGYSYFAYYPAAEKVLTSDDKVKLDMEGQKQTGNNSLTCLGDFDYMYASKEGVKDGSVKFSFKHLISLVRFRLTAEASYSLAKAVLETGGNDIVTQAELSISNGEVKATETNKSLELEIEDCSAQTDETITLWMAMLPTEALSGKSLKLRVTDTSGEEHIFDCKTGFKIEAGKAYSIECGKATPRQKASLTFSEAAGRYSYGSPVEYTNDSGEWVICVYSDGSSSTGFQLNKNKVAYIGTPEFDGRITGITIKMVRNYYSNFYLCTEKGGTTESGVICSITGQGGTTTAKLENMPEEGRIWIRSSATANISAIELTVDSGQSESEDTPFTRLDALGFYSDTDSETPNKTEGVDGEYIQYSYSNISYGRTFRIMNHEKGNMSELQLYSSATAAGSEIGIVENHIGETESSSEATVKVVKKKGKKLWLDDKTDHKGYIIEIQ